MQKCGMVIDTYAGLDTLKRIVVDREPISLSADVWAGIEASYAFLSSFAHDKVIYGVNTGFGPMAQYRVGESDRLALQYNIIRSHATGAGSPLPPLYVRAAMVARLYTLVQGCSGVHRSWVEQLVAFINHDICPVVPEHGSVGASGDLVQLAHIALALIGEGEVYYRGERRPTAEVLSTLGLAPATIYLREGLAMCNGTSMMTGIGLINLLHAQRLLEHATHSAVLMNEIASSYDDFVAPPLSHAKRHHGQRYIAERMRALMHDSRALRQREAELYRPTGEAPTFAHKVQPYYSLRCTPQILGPIYDELVNAERVLLDETCSVCDNPVVDLATASVYHGGNFHGDYVAYEMDKLKIGITKLTMLAERQLNYLMHDRINGILPPFVNMGVLGLHYGMQASQFTATSTTAESQTLSVPMYIHSIPSNNDNQDIVSMGTNAALLTARVLENAYQVLAIQCIAMAQAVDILDLSSQLSSATRRLYDAVRSLVPAFVEDRPRYREIEAVINYLKRL